MRTPENCPHPPPPPLYLDGNAHPFTIEYSTVKPTKDSVEIENEGCSVIPPFTESSFVISIENGIIKILEAQRLIIHTAFFFPISCRKIIVVVVKYGPEILRRRQLEMRAFLLTFVLCASYSDLYFSKSDLLCYWISCSLTLIHDYMHYFYWWGISM